MRHSTSERRRHGPWAAVGALVCAACSSAAREASPAGAGEAVVATASCPPPLVAVRDDSATVARQYDVAYATRSGDSLRYDVAWPKGGGPRPLVVLLHGGGWEGGSRASMRDEMLAFARHGYAAATVQYRLTRAPDAVFPAAVADVRCAVRVLRSRAASYDADPDRIAAVGYSAGAHLASMLGAAADVEGLDESCAAAGASPAVRAVVSVSGPQDLRARGHYTAKQKRLVTNFLGVFPGDDPARASLASPIVHASPGDPPFLFVQGTSDRLVPVDHPRRMAAELRRVGTPATVVELRGHGHSWVGLLSSRDDRVRCTTTAFLARWLSD